MNRKVKYKNIPKTKTLREYVQKRLRRFSRENLDPENDPNMEVTLRRAARREKDDYVASIKIERKDKPDIYVQKRSSHLSGAFNKAVRAAESIALRANLPFSEFKRRYEGTLTSFASTWKGLDPGQRALYVLAMPFVFLALLVLFPIALVSFVIGGAMFWLFDNQKELLQQAEYPGRSHFD